MYTITEYKASSFTQNSLLDPDYSGYSSNFWTLGKGIVYDSPNLGFRAAKAYYRNNEASAPFACGLPYDVSKNQAEAYVFLADTATASATRRVRLLTYNALLDTVTDNGFITLTLPTATNHTTRDFRIDYKTYTTGTASASGTAVTGTGTSFVTAGVAVGARIGFGSTDPTQITTWYRISAVGSATGLTLSTSAGAVPNGDYIIEEFRPIFLTTNATVTNGGVFIAKGVSIEDFTPSGVTISAATTVDNIKACYWLKDASTQTNTVGAGIALAAGVGDTSRTLYCLNTPSAGNYNVYTYNVRAALSGLASGASTSAWGVVTGTQAVTGTVSQLGNLALATANHGAGSGVQSLYFVTTTRVYRAATANITSGNVTWQSDNIVEVPPGGTSTFAATSTLASISYSPNTDRFLVTTTGLVNYYSQYVTSGNQFEKAWGRQLGILNSSTSDQDYPFHYSLHSSGACTPTVLEGKNITCLINNSTTTGVNLCYFHSFGADWDYAQTTEGYLISPKILTTDATQYLRVHVSEDLSLGGNEHTMRPEPYKIYFRTTNIDTNASSDWALVPDSGDISSYSGASSCQVMLLFKTIGAICLPSLIFGISVSYITPETDNRWAFSEDKSDSATKRIAFRQVSQYGTNYPSNLKIEIRNAITNTVILTDTLSSPSYGTVEKSTDGSSWGSYNTTDRTSGSGGDNTYIRYTPTSDYPTKVNVRLY